MGLNKKDQVAIIIMIFMLVVLFIIGICVNIWEVL